MVFSFSATYRKRTRTNNEVTVRQSTRDNGIYHARGVPIVDTRQTAHVKDKRTLRAPPFLALCTTYPRRHIFLEERSIQAARQKMRTSRQWWPLLRLIVNALGGQTTRRWRHYTESYGKRRYDPTSHFNEFFLCGEYNKPSVSCPLRRGHEARRAVQAIRAAPGSFQLRLVLLFL